MNIKSLLATLVVTLCLAAPVLADAIDDGYNAYNRGDYAEAVKWYRKSAEQGNFEAQMYLGLMYAEGKGVPQNYAKAAAWYRKSAEQGNSRAQFNLGNNYLRGEGVPQDITEAVKLYRRSAKQGDNKGQGALGLMYLDGEGVPQDFVEAHKWFNLSASQGNKSSAILRDVTAKKMTPAQIAEAQRLAREWKPKK